jgi:hypothetical protein
MRKRLNNLDLVIGAMMQLDPLSGERQNVLAFIRSCYCGRVQTYDLDLAVASLTRLTDEAQHALIAWIVMTDECVPMAG